MYLSGMRAAPIQSSLVPFADPLVSRDEKFLTKKLFCSYVYLLSGFCAV